MTEEPKLPSERSFGVLFTLVFLLLGAYFKWKGWSDPATYTVFGFAIILCAITIFAPALLRPFNRGWFAFGLLLGRVVSPIVLGIMFFGLITPIALVTRAASRDVLHIRRKSMDSYWLAKKSTILDLQSFRNQF